MARVPRAPSKVRALNHISPAPVKNPPRLSRPQLPKLNLSRHTREFSFYLRDHRALFYSLIFLLFCLLTFFILFVFVFRTQTIVCSLNSQPCPAFIQHRLEQLFAHRRLLFTNLDQKLLEQDDLAPLLSSTGYRRFLPSTLEINLESVPFLYRLSLENNTIFYVDANSRLWQGDHPLITTRSLTVLPVTISDSELLNFFALNQTLPDQTLIVLHDFALQYLSRADSVASSTLHVNSSENYYLDFTSGPDYIFDPTAIELSWQKYDWLAAHSSAASLDQYQSIDLHFNSPVGVLK